MTFFRNVLAAILGTLVALGIIFFMFLIFAAIAGSGSSGIKVEKNSILELKLNKPLKDYGGKHIIEDINFVDEDFYSLNHVLTAIKKAQTDDKIKGISLKLGYVQAGISQTKAIRDALEDFKSSGKFVYAYSDFYFQKGYYLASVADSVFVNPVGGTDFRGLWAEVLYYKKLQEKSGVKMEVIRKGKYKSAVEPYLEDEMSEANREQLSSLISSLWDTVLEEIGSSRGKTIPELNAIADELGARTPKLAKASGMIDGSLYNDEYEDILKNKSGTEEDEDIEYIAVARYAEALDKKAKKSADNQIAVVYAQGEIQGGKGNNEIIGPGIMKEALRKAAEDDKIKAVVLRVNSPGGSSLASDKIWREVEKLKTTKPVVVSMGNLAASGGYYISCGAQKIFAEPTTITGSIGAFGAIPNVSNLANDWGINAEHVVTNKQSMYYSIFEPMTDEFRAYAQESIGNTYDIFLERVAQGRNMTTDQVDSLAQGRVWSGTQALELGLVDALGGLEDAVAEAAKLADVEEYKVRNLPVYKTSFEEIFEQFSGVSMGVDVDKIIREELGPEMHTLIKNLKTDPKNWDVKTRLPYEISIK